MWIMKAADARTNSVLPVSVAVSRQNCITCFKNRILCLHWNSIASCRSSAVHGYQDSSAEWQPQSSPNSFWHLTYLLLPCRRTVHFFAGADKAKAVLGWQPQHNFLADVDDLVAAYKASGREQKDIDFSVDDQIIAAVGA